MIGFLLPTLLAGAAPGPCTVPESMPAPTEALAGEGDADWCLAGDDPFAIAGPDLNPPVQLFAKDEAGGAMVIQWRRSGTPPPPANWRKVFTRVPLTSGPSEFREILVQRLGDNVFVITSNPAWRIGNAICSGEGGVSTGYLPVGVTPSATDRKIIADLGLHQEAIDPGNVLCTLLHAEGGGYSATYRGPQGRPLPEIDDYYANTRFRVTQPGDFERYLSVTR